MQFEIEALAFGVLIPALAGGLIALVSALQQHWGRLLPATCGAMAAFSGFALAWWLFDWAPLEPIEFWQWQLVVTTVATAAALLMSWKYAPAAARIAVCAAVAVGGAWRIVPDGEAGWSDMAPFRAALVGSFALSVFFVWIVIDRASRRPQRLSLWWLAACALVGAVVLFQSGNTKFAQLSGALGAAVIGAAAVCTWRPSADLVRGAAGPVVTTLGGLAMSGYVNTYNEIPRACFLLLMVAPLGIVAGDWLAPRAPGWIRSAVSGAAVAAILALAIGLAFSFSDSADEW